jgi:outer membrane protein assembly factor BamB
MLGWLLRLLKKAAIVVGVFVIVGAVLYAVGYRVELDGGGMPHIRYKASAAEKAEQIARHREQQRAQAQTSAPVADPTPVPAAAPAAPPTDGTARADDPTPAVSARGWTDFRGPRRNGAYTERAIFTNWPAGGLKPVWKQPVGGGYASFAGAGGRAFTIEQRGTQEVVAAYDVATGRELWTNAWDALFSEQMGGDGPRATPTWAEGRVYALGATGELRVLDDATGRVVWRTDILKDAGAGNLPWGMAASPLIVDDTVVVLPGGPSGQSVVAYDRASGRRAWAALDDMQAYSSPMLVTIAGVRQILVFSASRVLGLKPDGSGVLWEFPWKTMYDVNASQPLLIGDDRVFLSTGYGTGAVLIELTPGANGLTPREIWRTNRMKNQFSSSVVHDGFIYGLDESILACIDAATGELKWKGGRYGYGQIMLASGHLIVLTEDGDVALVRASPDRHQEIVRFPALEGKTWSHPALFDGRLLIRNVNEMAAFDLRVK